MLHQDTKLFLFSKNKFLLFWKWVVFQLLHVAVWHTTDNTQIRLYFFYAFRKLFLRRLIYAVLATDIITTILLITPASNSFHRSRFWGLVFRIVHRWCLFTFVHTRGKSWIVVMFRVLVVVGTCPILVFVTDRQTSELDSENIYHGSMDVHTNACLKIVWRDWNVTETDTGTEKILEQNLL